MQYLLKHRDNFYFKKRLPQTQKNLVLSIKTNDKHEANFIVAIITARLSIFLQDTKLTPIEEFDLIKETVRQYVEEAKSEYGYYSDLREEQYKYTNKKGDELLGSHPKALKKAIKKLTDMMFSNKKIAIYNQIVENLPIKEEFENILKSLSPSGQDQFRHEVIKGEVELLYFDKARNERRVSTVQNTPTYLVEDFASLIQTNITPQQNLNNQSVNIQYQSDYKQRYHEKTAEEVFKLFIRYKIEVDKITDPKRYETIITIFLELIGQKYLIDITHDDLEDFIADFLCLPDQNKNNKLYKEHTYKEVIEIAKQKDIPPIAENTLGNKLININAFLDYAVKFEYLDKNRLKGKLNLSTKGSDDKRKEYYDEQLNSLFRSRWYTTELKINLEKYPSKVWIPLILLFQGCRLNEIAQLYFDQIKFKQDVYFFRIAADHPDQKLKNPTSKRTIPIHPTLIELGFLEFVESQKAKGYIRIFQELYHTKDKGYGQAFSKHFNDRDYKEEWLDVDTMKLLEEETILLDLHSFRHNFSGSLKGLIEDGLLDHFTGHLQNSEAQKRYGKFRAPLQLEMISKCTYPELDISILKNHLNLFYQS